MATLDTHVASARGWWQRLNIWAGYLVFGFPAVAVVPALIAATAKFGLLDTLASVGTAAIGACLPLLSWACYTRCQPGTGKFTWAVIGIAAVGALAFSPLFFWAEPALLVVLSEFLRLVTGLALFTVSSMSGSRWRAVRFRRSR